MSADDKAARLDTAVDLVVVPTSASDPGQISVLHEYHLRSTPNATNECITIDDIDLMLAEIKPTDLDSERLVRFKDNPGKNVVWRLNGIPSNVRVNVLSANQGSLGWLGMEKQSTGELRDLFLEPVHFCSCGIRPIGFFYGPDQKGEHRLELSVLDDHKPLPSYVNLSWRSTRTSPSTSAATVIDDDQCSVPGAEGRRQASVALILTDEGEEGDTLYFTTLPNGMRVEPKLAYSESRKTSGWYRGARSSCGTLFFEWRERRESQARKANPSKCSARTGKPADTRWTPTIGHPQSSKSGRSSRTQSERSKARSNKAPDATSTDETALPHRPRKLSTQAGSPSHRTRREPRGRELTENEIKRARADNVKPTAPKPPPVSSTHVSLESD